ncbi:transglutaminase-like cysteine peptidase [Sphingopyxis sp.]|jgi:predicted transglutaminase-like cysteine proteinase|uniref:transglutaminase-like cysteine peptidase n=1 Tax=Sphingopyxis sp. TaxID=1908224 RepID=UPI003F723786
MARDMIARLSPPAFTGFAALAVAAAAVMLPATAHAAIGAPTAKAANAKHFAFGDSCHVAAALPSSVPSVAAPRPVAPDMPSALERMRMSQERPAPIVEITPARGTSVAARAMAAGADRLFKPAQALTSIASPRRIDCTDQVAAIAAPALDDDSELGTLAIPVETTRFDDRWARVRRAPAARLMQAQLDRAAVTRGLGEAATLERINLWVNRQIAYVEDDRNYRQRDFWATADETVGRGSGDCEDLAILKMHMLRAAGIDDDRMKLVLLRDLAINADHAFLLVRSSAGWVVLDNMTDRIYDGRQANAVRPILSFSGNRRWVHGYRNSAVPIVMAASTAVKASSAVFASAAPAAAERRSFKTTLAMLAGTKLAFAHRSIVNELPRMFGRLAARGTR